MKTLRLQTLSPVHIGGNEELTPMDYLIDQDLLRINIPALFKDPDFAPIAEPFLKVAGSRRYLGDAVPIDLLRRHVLYKLFIRGDAEAYLRDHQTNVKAIVKSAGRIYLPGSSIKGALLSALMWFTLKDLAGQDRNNVKSLLAADNYDELLKLILGKIAARPISGNARFSRWLDVSDSSLLPPTALEVSLVRIHGAAEGKEQPILYETIKPGTEFVLRIKAGNCKYSEQDIVGIADQFYQRVCLEDGGQMNAAEQIFRLGQGSSAFATSLLILAKDWNMKEYPVSSPKTRKRIDQQFAMGWLGMQFAD